MVGPNVHCVRAVAAGWWTSPNNPQVRGLVRDGSNVGVGARIMQQGNASRPRAGAFVGPVVDGTAGVVGSIGQRRQVIRGSNADSLPTGRGASRQEVHRVLCAGGLDSE